MSETKPKAYPAWFMGGVLILLALLVGLTWLNGAMLNRQHHELAALREDIQFLTESLEQSLPEGELDYGALPPSRPDHARHFQRVQQRDDDADRAVKDVEESRRSAAKAVRDARETQQKLSIEENARLAEEASRRKAAERSWRPWFFGALAIAFLALAIRSWARRRG